METRTPKQVAAIIRQLWNTHVQYCNLGNQPRRTGLDMPLDFFLQDLCQNCFSAKDVEALEADLKYDEELPLELRTYKDRILIITKQTLHTVTLKNIEEAIDDVAL